ncbi:haloacid dehalogenase [Actinomyces lilanjuaniae]|uniref:Haloacid dehalogenase n=1 Tax=Actinomyces lilanjuaniae TaxID=2321394 RepID=A0ABM6Z2J2_9ACTO|nr:HAD hydrolase family protein [Actinomyces lilanjuaniae]AYD89431.1 haloacid dehalogenase [Actinomyces lilanjuaniae]
MLTSPVGLVTDLDGTVVFDGVADPQLPSFLRRVSQRGDVSVIVATSRAPRGVAEVLGDAVTCLDGMACFNGALLRLGSEERRHCMRRQHVRAVVDAAFRIGVPAYVDQGHSFTVLTPPGREKGLGSGLEHMRDYLDGRWCADPAQVPVDDVLKVTVVSRGLADSEGAVPGWGAGAAEGAGVLQALLGLRLDGVTAYPHEDGVVDVCAAGVDKSICMRLLPGGEALAATSSTAINEGTDVAGEPATTAHTAALLPQAVSTWVAAGNDVNDVAMIRAADVGITVGDGLEGVRARRQTVRVPSRPGAVVSVLERMLGL